MQSPVYAFISRLVRETRQDTKQDMLKLVALGLQIQELNLIFILAHFY